MHAKISQTERSIILSSTMFCSVLVKLNPRDDQRPERYNTALGPCVLALSSQHGFLGGAKVRRRQDVSVIVNAQQVEAVGH